MLTVLELDELSQCVEGGMEVSDLETPDEDGWCLIHSAAYYGNIKILSYIIRQNSNIEPLVPGTHMTPLLLAATSGCYEAVLLLLKRGANINSTDHMGR